MLLSTFNNFPTWIAGCDTHSPALLDLYISSDCSICSTVAFPALGFSDHFVVSFCIDFTLTKGYFLYHCTACHLIFSFFVGTVFMIIRETFHGTIYLNLVFLLLVLNFVSWSRLTGQISLISMIFSCLCCYHKS